jgi:hypothetical protein
MTTVRGADDAGLQPDGRALGTLPPSALVILVAWLLLVVAIAPTNGHWDGRGLLFAILSAVAVIAAGVVLRWGPRRPAVPAAWALAAVVGCAIAGAVVWEPGLYARGPALPWSRWLAVLAAVVALLTVSRPRWLRTAAWTAVLVMTTAAGVLMVVASPAPRIDVWVILQQAADVMLRGGNVFTSCWTANTDPLTDCVYPYLPMTTVLQIPFAVGLDDVRYALVAALLGASVMVHRIAGTAAASALAALLLLQPKLLFAVEQSWTEPLLLVALCVMVWATLRGRGVVAVAAFAVALASKQHMLLLLPLAAWWPAFGTRRAALSLAVAAAVVAPFALGAPEAFVGDAFWFHLDLPPRPDALSLYSLALRRGDVPPFWIVPLATAAALGLALALPRTAAGFVLGSAGVLLIFNLANKQTFFNHQSLVVWLLVLAVAVLSREQDAGPAGVGASAAAVSRPGP